MRAESKRTGRYARFLTATGETLFSLPILLSIPLLTRSAYRLSFIEVLAFMRVSRLELISLYHDKKSAVKQNRLPYLEPDL